MAEQDPNNDLATVAAQFTNIAHDLFNIEVNIILRDNITAQKMPNPRHALLDIGKEYGAALDGMELRRQEGKPESGEKSILLEDNMFDMMRRKMGYVTDEELSLRKSLDIVDEDKIISPKVGQELGGFDAFDVIRNWADSLIDDVDKENFLSSDQLAVLPRIKDNADLLKGMYSSICRRDPVLNDPDATDERNLSKQLSLMADDKITPNTIVKLSKKIDFERTIALTNEYTRADLVNRDDIESFPLRESDLVSIRKIWELGTEVIVMQTIVQVDGDVITRLNPDYLDGARYPQLHDYHNRGVQIALAHWATLVQVAKELVVATAQGISGRLSG